ncbi:uncharacterized protein LOC135811302 [Sycon ciliatum]|uniref:uncharacterized protein LOC135811302 n=1 Tax=Sycon ciliatum TaxID=27933 RepID=UPI0031F6A249
MSSRKHDVQARRSSRRATPGAYQCGNPFHYQWGSTSTRKDKNARKSLLNVLSSISGRNIKSICRYCRHVADEKPEVTSHPLYKGPSVLNTPGVVSRNDAPPFDDSVDGGGVASGDGSACGIQCGNGVGSNCGKEVGVACAGGSVGSLLDTIGHGLGSSLGGGQELGSGSTGGEDLDRDSLGGLELGTDNVSVQEEGRPHLLGQDVSALPDIPCSCCSELQVQLLAKEAEIKALRLQVGMLENVRDEQAKQLAEVTEQVEGMVKVDELLAQQVGRVNLVEKIVEKENMLLFSDTVTAIQGAKSSRTVANLLAIPEGRLTARPYNPVVEAFVTGITKPLSVSGSDEADRKRAMRQQEAIECIHAARNLNYCSDFHVLFQSIVYAVTQSRVAVDLIGHLGPGGSYTLVKDWLANLGGERISVPPGFVTIGFDNEQRQLKSYLSRGANRSTYEVLTNVVYAVNDDSSVQSNEQFHFRHWVFPSVAELQNIYDTHPETTDSHSPMHAHLLQYMDSRINNLLMEAKYKDPVDTYGREEERAKKVIVCPGCKTEYEKRKVKCSNTECAVENLRAAIASATGQSRVSTEVIRVPRQGTVGHGTQYVYKNVADGAGVVVGKVRSGVHGASENTLPPADVGLLEPVFVNPNSHEAVRVLLREIGKDAGVNQCLGDGSGTRHWVNVVCDGLPYSLMRTVLGESREAVRLATLNAAGVLNSKAMGKQELVGALRERGLSTAGSLTVLRTRLDDHLQLETTAGNITMPHHYPDAEFDWVVCQSGGLHWEMNLIQAVIKTLFPFVYKEFLLCQGYTSPRQLDWAHKAKDHHRAYDELSRFTDGCVDELLRPYVLHCGQDARPTAHGFLAWAEKLKGNHVFTWLLHCVVQYCFPAFMLRRGMRHDDIDLYLAARRTMSPLLHARNHTTYQLIELYEEQQRLATPPDLRKLLDRTLFLSRSGRTDAHQAVDAVVEELNANMKAWVSGDKDSNMWRHVARNYNQLVTLRSKVFGTLRLTDPKSTAKAQPSYEKELVVWRHRLRSFLCPGEELALHRPLESMSSDEDMLDTAVDLTDNGKRRRRELCESFGNGQWPKTRSSKSVHFLTTDEKEKVHAESNRSVASLKREFHRLVQHLPDQALASELAAQLQVCSTSQSALDVVKQLRSMVNSITDVQPAVDMEIDS